MNLIRNGGFETGDDSFWEHTGSGTFTVQSIEKAHGTYAGKLALLSGQQGELMSIDYHPVEHGELYNIVAYIKGSNAKPMYFKFYEYDGDLNLIRSTNVNSTECKTAFTAMYGDYSPSVECVYLRISVLFYALTVATDFYLDSVGLKRFITQNGVILTEKIADISDAVASSDTSGDRRYLRGFNTYYADMRCTSLTGTNPTCDITIVEKDRNGRERVLGTFAQLSGAGDERISVNPPIGTGVYVKYVEGGTWTDCDFVVYLTGVR